MPQTAAGLGEVFLSFLTIGAISFGGGIIAYLRNTLVENKKWLTPQQFLGALEISQTMPGTNSTNMAVIVGDFLCGPIGALAAFIGICLPGAVLALGLAAASSGERHNPIGHAALAGVTVAAVGILAAITVRTGRDAKMAVADFFIMALTFVGMAIFKIPLLILAVVFGGVAVLLHRPKAAERA